MLSLQAHETHCEYKKMSGKLVAKKYAEDEKFKEDFEVACALCDAVFTYVCSVECVGGSAVFAHLFVFFFKVIRDSVIEVYAEDPSSRCGAKDIEKQKKVLQVATKVDKTLKTGLEYEKSVFLEEFKDRPDLIKRAKYFTARIKDPATGRFIVEQHTRVYEQRKGIWNFEESDGVELRNETTLDDGRFQFADTPNQQQTVFDDTASLLFQNQSGKNDVVMADVRPEPSSSARPDAAPRKSLARGAVDSKKADEDVKSESDDDDDMSPMERAMKQEHVGGKPKAKAKSKAGAAVAAGARSMGAGGGGHGSLQTGAECAGKMDVATKSLFDEVDRELKVFKSLVKLEDGCEETFVSLSARLQAKRTALAKKVHKKAGGDNLAIRDNLSASKSRVQAMTDAVKSALQFQRKKNRKHASVVMSKFHAMKIAGVSLDSIPTCFAIMPMQAQAFILAIDGKWKESSEFITKENVQLHAPEATDHDTDTTQGILALQAQTECARSLCEAKEVKASASSKLHQMISRFVGLTAGKPLILAILLILGDSDVNVEDLNKASTV